MRVLLLSSLFLLVLSLTVDGNNNNNNIRRRSTSNKNEDDHLNVINNFDLVLKELKDELLVLEANNPKNEDEEQNQYHEEDEDEDENNQQQSSTTPEEEEESNNNPITTTMDIRVPSIDMYPSQGAKSSGIQFSCMTRTLLDDNDGTPLSGHIVGWEALLDHSHDIHHMDLFLCSAGILNDMEQPYEDDSRKCSSIPFTAGKYCHGFGAIYDKGAVNGYHFPENVGIQYGVPNTPTEVFVLQVHYLYPNEPPVINDGAENLDSSGMRLYLSPHDKNDNNRMQNARMIAFMDTNLSIPQNAKNYVHEYQVTNQHIQRVAGRDLAAQERQEPLTMFAMHMHAHNMCQAMTVHHQWSSQQQYTTDLALKDMMSYHGYGEDQDWKSLDSTTSKNNKRSLLLEHDDDTLTISCAFDTTSDNSHHNIHYGVGLHDEMCGIVILYYPTNDTLNALGEFVLIEPMSPR